MQDLKLGSRVRIPIRSVSYVGLVVLCAAVLTFGAVFFVWQRYQYIRLGFEVNQLRRERLELQDQIEPLEVEAAYLARPERIDAVARGKLGLHDPRANQIVVLEPHGTESQ